jgi:GTPase Era involved in 16S rRNA processing
VAVRASVLVETESQKGIVVGRMVGEGARRRAVRRIARRA